MRFDFLQRNSARGPLLSRRTEPGTHVVALAGQWAEAVIIHAQGIFGFFYTVTNMGSSAGWRELFKTKTGNMGFHDLRRQPVSWQTALACLLL
jgi:hypothetical protein